MNIKFGYARVFPHDQTRDLQIDALTQAGCDPDCIHTDTCAGSVACADRPALQRLRDQMRPGDTLVVWRLDRLGRNLQDLISFVDGLKKQDVQFTSLMEQMDTATHTGQLVFHIFGALAEYERGLIRERAEAGAAAARARGRMGGRPRVLTPEKLQTAQALMRDPSISVAQVCRTVGVSRRTLYRHLKTTDREQNQTLADRFQELADQWEHETFLLSNTGQAIAHPAHAAIVKLGDPVVPLILERMRTRGGHWYHALHDITKANPVNPADHGNVAAIQQAWLRWGRDHGRI